MTKLTTFLICLLAVGCGKNPTQQPINSNENSIVGTVVIEGCQYLKVNAYMGYSFTHKGNCNNPIHNNSPFKSVWLEYYKKESHGGTNYNDLKQISPNQYLFLGKNTFGTFDSTIITLNK